MTIPDTQVIPEGKWYNGSCILSRVAGNINVPIKENLATTGSVNELFDQEV